MQKRHFCISSMLCILFSVALSYSTDIIETMFRPSIHGWHFDNTFVNMHEHVDMSGLEALGFDRIYYGLSAGMCLTALDRYHGGIPMDMTTDLPEQGSSIFNQLIDRQDNFCNVNFWRKAYTFQRLSDQGPFNIGSFTKQEWNKVKAKLDAGIPVALCLIKTEGYENPSKNPIVIAYKYLFSLPSERVVLWIYDTQEPRDNNIRVFFNTTTDINIVQSNDGMYGQIRGFFMIDYDRDEIIGRINSMGINSCTYDQTLAVEKNPGEIVRMDRYNLNFRWSCNFVPGYSILVNHEYHTPLDGDVYQDIVCPSRFGNLTLPIYLEFGDFNYKIYTVRIMDQEASSSLFLQLPWLNVYPFLHNPQDSVFIVDARKPDDVKVYDASPTEEEIEQYMDRLILVRGERSGTGSHFCTYDHYYQLGHVKVPIYFDIDESYMANPVTDIDLYKLRPQGQGTSNDLLAILTNIPIPDEEKDRFLVFDGGDAQRFGFSEQDYNDDVFTLVLAESNDDIDQRAVNYLRFYARSLLYITVPIYSANPPGSDWDDLVDYLRQYIDRDLFIRIGDDDFDEREMKKIAKKIGTSSNTIIDEMEILYPDIKKDKNLMKKIAAMEQESYDIAMARTQELIHSGKEYKVVKMELQIIKNKMLERNKTMMVSLIIDAMLDHLEKKGKLKTYFDGIKKGIK
jgi:hypothetical protein